MLAEGRACGGGEAQGLAVFVVPKTAKTYGAMYRREVTQLLVAWRNGDEKAFEALAPLVYQELHRLARGYMKKERPGHTLQCQPPGV
jgi:hypothetical protein